MKSRYRSLPFQGELGGETQWEYLNAATRDSLDPPIKGSASGFISPLYLSGSQFTDSESHPEWKSRKGPIHDIGGEFYTERTYVSSSIGKQAMQWTSKPHSAGLFRTRGVYHGPCLAYVPASFSGPGSFLPYQVSDEANLRVLGTTAIARCKPTNSTANLAVALGELYRERLPHLVGSSLWKAKALRARNAGEEYLNAQFGYLPLASDISDFAQGVVDSGSLLDNYISNAGKVVRRSYAFQPTIKQTDQFWTNTQGLTAGLAGSDAEDQLAWGTVTRTDTIARRQWFSGAFTYALPDWFTPSSAADRYRLYAEKILGVELTPDTLWNLAPWTWAADWFSNAGDVIANVTDWSVDGLSLRYGYLMEHTVSSRSFTWEAFPGENGKLHPSTVTLVSETKKRVKATPFGFGFTWDSLSPRQLAILGALGLTR